MTRGRSFAVRAGVGLVLLSAALLVPASATAAGPAQPGGVEIAGEVGVAGVTGASATTPVRLQLRAPRSATVDVDVTAGQGSVRRYRVELNAGAPVSLDTVVPSASVGIDVEVRSPDGDRLASKAFPVAADPRLVLVGLGGSLAAPAGRVPTVAGIQEAATVPLDASVFDRPGALEALSQVVLAPADVDRLGAEERRALGDWVATGGVLTVDGPRSDPLPVVGTAAGAGNRSAVGGGWVVFTDGRAGRGAWSEVLEPSVVPAFATVAEDPFFFGGDDSVGLVDVSYVPTWQVVAAVFGTALLAGPLLWFALRTRSRRRWMWLATPGLSAVVALALLVVGQSVFTNAEPRYLGVAHLTSEGAEGTVAMGLKESATLRLAPGADLLMGSESSTVTAAGAERVVEVPLARNSFGYVSLGPVALPDAPRVELTATVGAGGEPMVSITNHHDRALEEVTLSGWGHSVSVEPVPPGGTVTEPFGPAAGVGAFAPAFEPSESMMTGWLFGAEPELPDSTGVVRMTARVDANIGTGDHRGPGPLLISALAPLTGTAPSPDDYRVEQLGWLPDDGGVFVDGGELFVGDDGVDGSGGSFPSTTAVGGGGVAQAELPPAHVRFSTPAGRPAGTCAVHTIVSAVDRWDGGAWVPLDKVGTPYADDHFEGPDEVQDWALPELAAGEALYLRLQVPVPDASVLSFDCRERS